MLKTKLLEVAAALTEAERDNFKLLLGMAAGQLAPSQTTTFDGDQNQAYRVVAGCLASLQPHSARIPASGIAWQGRPSFLAPILGELQRESRDQRASAIKHDEHFLSCGGPVADELALSRDLTALIEVHAGPVTSTGTASYIYYDELGQNICPHIDTDIFSINALIMLRHDAIEADRSALELFTPDGGHKLIFLEPGEMIVFWADSVIHSRTPVRQSEAVNIVTIGFQPTPDKEFRRGNN